MYLWNSATVGRMAKAGSAQLLGTVGTWRREHQYHREHAGRRRGLAGTHDSHARVTRSLGVQALVAGRLVHHAEVGLEQELTAGPIGERQAGGVPLQAGVRRHARGGSLATVPAQDHC